VRVLMNALRDALKRPRVPVPALQVSIKV
jgi:hypothetical protein